MIGHPQARKNNMTYHFSKIVDMSFDKAVAATTDALKNHGFGVLTQINVKDALHKKLGVDFRPYLILGACNPKMAHQALIAEDKIGTMLPCNVVVQQRDDNRIEVSAVDPVASMSAIKNPQLSGIAGQVSELLKQAIAEIH
jgi:uncharacterized protein (DUF302 family)